MVVIRSAQFFEVLGGLNTGLLTRTLSAEYNLDDPTLSGIYSYAYGSDVDERGFLLAFPNTSSENGRRAIQVVFKSSGKIKMRSKTNTDAWTNWREITLVV